MSRSVLKFWLVVGAAIIGTESVAQQRFKQLEHPWQIGIVVDPTVLRHLSFSGNGVKPPLPTALVLKHHFHRKNSFNIFLSYGDGDGLSNYTPELRYRFEGFNLHAGYEHVFFAPRRFNLLTGAKLGYIYSRDMLPGFAYSNILNPNMLTFHSRLGPGADLGARFNISQRFGIESNISFICTWPMPYNESFKSWRNKGEFSIHRAISLDVYYRFGKPAAPRTF